MRLLWFLVTLPLCPAAEVKLTDRIVPLVQDGGGWTTTITLVNLESKAAPFEMLFHTTLMDSWKIAVSGSEVKAEGAYVRGTIAAGATLTFRTSGGSSTVQSGYAFLFSPDGARLGGKAVLHQAGSQSSLTLPLSPEREDHLVIPFDNSNGSAASLLWLTETQYTQVDYLFTALDGTILLAGNWQFSTEDASAQQLFSLQDRFPSLKDKQGLLTLDVTYPNAGRYDDRFFTALALQSDSNGNVSPVGSMATQTWKSNPY